MRKRLADILILFLAAAALGDNFVTLRMTADDNRIETATTACYYRNTLPTFSEMAADWLVIRPQRKAAVFFDKATGKQKVYFQGTEYTITNLYRFAEYAGWADPNGFPESATPAPTVDPNVAGPNTVDPNSWTDEQKDLYKLIMGMLGE